MKFTEFIRKNARIAGAVLMLAVVGVAALVALTTARAPAGDRQAAGQADRLPRGAMLTLETTYASCGHGASATEALVCLPDDVDRAELQSLYPDWQVTVFSSSGATLTRALAMPCEKHCLISLSGARITISRLTDGAMKVVGSAAVQRETLDPELIARLEAGCLTDTLAQAESLIEDIES